MHDIKWIRENTEEFDKAMIARGLKAISSDILALDEERRQLITLLQRLQQARNEKVSSISKISDKNNTEYIRLKKDASDIKEKISELEVKLESDKQLEDLLSSLPNISESDVPVGANEAENKEIKKWGNPRVFDFAPIPHFELGVKLGMMDFEQTVKISGSRFVSLFGDLSRLERALSAFMLDLHTSKYNFTEVSPPYLVREEAMFGVGQLPKFADDSFVTSDNRRLIPTAEVSLTNMVAGKILEESELPLRYTAFTPCFRSEAGAAGRDTRGMIRVHQFQKVELVTICKPEESEKEHQIILSAAEEVLQLLELPYRVMVLCTGDIGFSSKKTYDLEVWVPSENKYREISSCSNCGDFQARRMKARYKSQAEKANIFVHTLNGSALAVGRTIVAILENYQNADGSITIPEKLVPYMGGRTVITP